MSVENGLAYMSYLFSTEIAVKTLNKIALNEQEQESDVILPRSKKIR